LEKKKKRGGWGGGRQQNNYGCGLGKDGVGGEKTGIGFLRGGPKRAISRGLFILNSYLKKYGGKKVFYTKRGLQKSSVTTKENSRSTRWEGGNFERKQMRRILKEWGPGGVTEQ